MDRAFVDELADDMQEAWGEAVSARGRELYATALEDVDAAAARAAFDEFLLEDRARRPSPGMLRSRALAQAATHAPVVADGDARPAVAAPAATAASADVHTDRDVAPDAPAAPAAAAASPLRMEPRGPIPGIPGSSTSARPATTGTRTRSAGATALILIGGALAGSAIFGTILSLVWTGVSTEPTPENFGGITGGIGLVLGLGLAWAYLVGADSGAAAPASSSAAPDALSLMSGESSPRAANGGAPPARPRRERPRPAPVDAAALMAGVGASPAAEGGDHTYLTAGQVRGLVVEATPTTWPADADDGDSSEKLAYTGASVAAGTFIGLVLSAPASPVRTPTADLDRSVVGEMVARARQALLIQLCFARPDRYDTDMFDLVERAEVARFRTPVPPAVSRRLMSWLSERDADLAARTMSLVNWALAPLGVDNSVDTAMNAVGLDPDTEGKMRALLGRLDNETAAILGAELAGEVTGTFGALHDMWLHERFLETAKIMLTMVDGDISE